MPKAIFYLLGQYGFTTGGGEFLQAQIETTCYEVAASHSILGDAAGAFHHFARLAGVLMGIYGNSFGSTWEFLNDIEIVNGIAGFNTSGAFLEASSAW